MSMEYIRNTYGVPAKRGMRVTAYGKPGVITGIRPEHLDITPAGWALRVEATEMLGAERLLYGRWNHGDGSELVTLRVDEALTPPELGATIHVTPRPDRIHHFDVQTGKRL